jgi:hypothetical protein
MIALLPHLAEALMLHTMQHAQSFFRNLEVAFETQALHAPRQPHPFFFLARDVAIVLFWFSGASPY